MPLVRLAVAACGDVVGRRWSNGTDRRRSGDG